SPAYLLYQRLGWAITLSPLFALLMLFFLSHPEWSFSPLLAGLPGGLGAANHLTFISVFVAITIVSLLSQTTRPRQLLTWWPYIIGFWAGFGMQFATLFWWKDDQGNTDAITHSFFARIHMLPAALHDILSGSSFVAQYTGHALAEPVIWFILALLVVGVALSLTLVKPRRYAWLWLLGLTVQVAGLVYIVDRFTLRYFVPFSL